MDINITLDFDYVDPAVTQEARDRYARFFSMNLDAIAGAHQSAVNTLNNNYADLTNIERIGLEAQLARTEAEHRVYHAYAREILGDDFARQYNITH